MHVREEIKGVARERKSFLGARSVCPHLKDAVLHLELVPGVFLGGPLKLPNEAQLTQ